MKAKDLAALLMQNPELEVMYSDCEYGTSYIKEVELVKVVCNDYANEKHLQNLRAEIELHKLDTSESLKEQYQELLSDDFNIEFWGTYDKFVQDMMRYNEERVERLRKFDAAQWSINLVA